jgi:hypothetical protein
MVMMNQMLMKMIKIRRGDRRSPLQGQTKSYQGSTPSKNSGGQAPSKCSEGQAPSKCSGGQADPYYSVYRKR